MSIDYVGESEECCSRWEEGGGEQEDQLDLPLYPHVRFYDDRNWEDHQRDVCDYVRDSQCEKLCVSLPASSSWVWNYLPVVCERLAFGQICDNHRDESEQKKPSDNIERKLVCSRPYIQCKSFEEFGDRKL